MAISWERHLGTIILGIILFILIHYFKIYKKYIFLFSALFISINITLPNSIRVFMPIEMINKNQFWQQKYQQRIETKKLSKDIETNSKLDDYSNLLFILDNKNDPYFSTILKYELIKINTIEIDSVNLIKFISSLSFKSSKLNILTDKKNLNKVKKLFQSLNKIYDNKMTLINKYSINDLSIYEISPI